MNSNEPQYDALIVGAGPAGSSAAIHLAMSGARVLLLERARFPRPKLCGEFISPECLTHFAHLGVMEHMLAAGGSLIKETVFYAPGGRSLRVPSAWLSGPLTKETGKNNVALGLSRAEMDARLLSRARDVGVDVREETQATRLIIENDLVRGIELRSGDGQTQSCRAQIVLDATGRTRGLCRQLERRLEHQAVGKKTKRASLVAFKAHLTGANEIRNACEIYFYQGGYGGLSGVEGRASNLCFIVSAQAVREKGSDPERLMREIVATNKRAGETLKNARVASPWLSVALENFGRQKSSLLPGLMAIGDAASFIDPFTGSGMLMALESGTLAAEVIAAELSSSAQLNLLRVQSIYQQRYTTRFAARLRFCSVLRRLAFAPRAIAEVAACVLGANEYIERSLARATRRASSSA